MNFIISHNTGKKAYTTNVSAYKIVKNTPVFIGSAYAIPESLNLDYLSQCMKSSEKYNKKSETIISEYRKGKHNIFKL